MTTTTYRQRDVKKSKFPATTSPLVTDYMDLVRSGQNFKVLISDLVTLFGASGPLQVKGESTGTPILSVVSGVNYIRNVVDGPGIVSALSPQDGLKLSHNFTPDKTGAAVLINENAQSPTIRSIQAGTGISVGASGNIIQISTSGSPGTTKTILVYTESDLPTPSAGVITLVANTHYLFQNDVSTANRIVMGENTIIAAADDTLITFTYTGTSNFITSVDKNFVIKDISLAAATGTMFDVSSTTGAHRMLTFNMGVTGLNGGTFDNLQVLFIIRSESTFTGDGYNFTNNFDVVRLDTFAMSIASGSGDGIDLGTATFSIIALENGFFNINSTGYAINGALASANINSGGLGTITRCSQVGTATFLNNLSPYDDLWEMSGNLGIANSDNITLVTHGGATIDITGALTPVIIGATWTDQISHRFTVTSGGRFTYSGNGTSVNVTASITGQRGASGTDTYSFYLYKNGVQVSASQVSRSFTNADGNVSFVWSLSLIATDYLELWVSNDTGTTDFVVTALTLRID